MVIHHTMRFFGRKSEKLLHRPQKTTNMVTENDRENMVSPGNLPEFTQ